MLTQICAEIRNYFVEKICDGEFEIVGGKIAPLDFVKENQYFRIVGSTFNDGVYKNSADLNLQDETFRGAVWAMSVPPSLVALSAKIKKWQESDEANPSAFVSESFGGYSYTKATNSKGASLGWKDVFGEELKPYRRARVL